MKKGQITLFIIIGVVLVMIAGILLYVRGKGETIPEAEVIAGRVPQELYPIKTYVDACIKDISLDALMKIGIHGGYIDLFDSRYIDDPLEINDLDPTEGDGILLSPPDRSTAVPYWWYLESENDCRDCYVTAKYVPRLDTMENQIALYVDTNLEGCLDGFKKFESQGFIITPTGDVKAKSTITEREVHVEVSYPLTVRIQDRESEIGTFFIRHDLRLKEIYNLAREIVMQENLDGYLEEIMENFIVLYSGFDTEKLPPRSARETSFVKKIWIKQAAKDKIQNILRLYIPLIEINKTKGAKAIVTGDIILDGGLRVLYREMLMNEYPDFEVNFLFFDWPIYVDIKPSLGQILTATNTYSVSYLLFGKQEFQEYQFFYDVSFPVIVQIRAKEELNNNSYTFMFGMEGNLRGDKTIREFMENLGRVGPSRPVFRVEAGEDIQSDEDYAGAPGIGDVPMPKTVMCGKRQQIGTEFYINISSSSGEFIQDANVKFGCGRHDLCTIGSAQLNVATNETMFKGRAPICVNGGFITVESVGHKSEIFAKLTSLPLTNFSLNATLQKYVVLNVSIQKVKLTRNILYRDSVDEWEGNYKTLLVPGELTKPDKTDQFIIKMDRIEENSISPEMSQMIIVDKTNPIPAMEQIKVLPGTYELSGFYFDYAGAFIEAEERCNNDDCTWIPGQPGLDMDIRIAGGLELNNDTGYWIIDESQLRDGAQIVELKVLSFPMPLYLEDISESGEINNISFANRIILEPNIR